MKLLCLIATYAIALITEATNAESVIHPYKISVPDREITDLQRRLDQVRWPHQLPGTSWEHGADLTSLKKITKYWRNEYDWRSAEKSLNAIPQFLTEIDGTQLHFVHAKSNHDNAIPLILLHGWPGSFFEFSKMIAPLTEAKDASLAFHTIVPSLPGFGFSGPTPDANWDKKRMAHAMLKLMDKLGYEQFYAHGTDIGSGVAQWMARLAPERVIGLHSNFILSSPPSPNALKSLSPNEHERFTSFQKTEMGYFILQETKPQTVGFVLNDSPIALLAWHAEKFQSWTDHNGSFLSAVDIDTFLTNLSIYWFTQTSGSSARVYRAGFLAGGNFAPQPKIDTPIGHAVFPHEVIVTPERWNNKVFNIVRRTEFDHGGHFPALEQPKALLRDIRDFVRFIEAKNGSK